MVIVLTAGLILCILGLIYLWSEVQDINQRLSIPSNSQTTDSASHTRELNRILDLEARVARLEEQPDAIRTA